MKIKNEKKHPSVIVLFLVLSFLTAKSFAQEDVVENISEVFSADKNTVLNIDSKYGDVDIRDWEKKEIKIDVKIIIRNLSNQKAKQVLESINIKLYKEGSTVHAQTEFDESFFKMLGNQGHHDDKKFEINYVVHMPSTTVLTLNNKYGDVFINKLESKSEISVKYGSLQANQLLSTGKEEMIIINLGYSKATIETCKWLKLNIKYSKINIQESQALVLMSKYSKVNIEKNSSIVCESKYDGYQVGSLNNFIAEAQYSNFRMDKLGKKLKLNTKYTDTKIEDVPASFEAIDIENSYGSINIGIDPAANYKIKGYAKYAKIHYPSSGRVNKFQENTEMSVEGIVGDGDAGNSYVKINTKYGSIKLVK